MRSTRFGRRSFMIGAAAATTAFAVGCSREDTDHDLQPDPDPYTAGLMATWWTVPRAVEVDGRTFAGGVSPQGVSTVVELGVPERYEISTAAPDEHNTPSLLLEPDRPPLVVVSARPEDHLVVRRGSGDPLDLSKLAPAVHIDLSAIGGRASYAQMFRTGPDSLILLTRVGHQADLDYAWAICRSEDWGDTWTSELLMTSGEQGYVLSTRSGETLRCVAYGHPRGRLRDLRTFTMDLSTGAITSGGATLANLDGTGLPFALQDLHIERPAPSGTRTRLLDVSAAGQIAYATWPESEQDAATYHVLEPDGFDTEIATAGARIGYTGEANYVGGAVFGTADELWLARNDNAGEWLVEPVDFGNSTVNRGTRGPGDTWTIERWTRDGTAWHNAQTVATGPSPLVRPYVPVGATSGPPVLWHKIEGHYTGFTSWSGDRLEWLDR